MSKLAKALTAAAGNAAGESLYVEDVFSTYLYEGIYTASVTSQTITNNIDLAGEGGLVWFKNRTSAANHRLIDTERGGNLTLISNSTGGNSNLGSNGITSFNSNGWTMGTASLSYPNGNDFCSWTFRKAEKFFDVVTYTGNGSSTNNVSHNLGDVPGFIVVKRTDSTGNFCVAAGDSSGNYKQLTLNNNGQSYVSTAKSNIADSSIFNAGYIGTNFDGSANTSGGSYVAYLFASDAGGFGDDGSESIIKCGSYTGTGAAGLEVDLGFEPQWLMFKRTDSTSDWSMFDVMRGIATGGDDARLRAQGSDAENTFNYVDVTATGFSLSYGGTDMNASGGNYIYIAIRRPMKTPESGTEVFAIGQGDGDADIPDYISNFPVDAAITKRTSAGNNGRMSSRLTGANYLSPNLTQAESADGAATFDFMNGWGSDGANRNTDEYAWMFKRATGFFDVVAYSGTGVAGRTVAHNLGAAPELMIVKKRNSTGDWPVYHSGFNAGVNPEQYKARLNSIVTQSADSSVWNNTAPNQDNFTLGASSNVNASSSTYIAYLFGTIAGVSKVGRYTGNGTSQTINCGFSSGARFVLIKAANDFSDWNVFDTSRGIVAGNDPYLKLNSTDAEVTTVDAIDPNSTGFDVVNGGGGYNMPNVNGVEYIFLAIA